MKRFLTILPLAAGLALGAGRAEAQVQIRMGSPDDSAVVALSVTTTRFWVSAVNLPAGEYSLQAAKLTFIYDPTLIESIVAEAVADTGFSTLDTSTSRPGAFTVTASGVAGGNPVNLFRLRVKLAAGAHDGGYLWVQVESLASPSYPNLASYAGGARSVAAQVCHATDTWGDVDGNGRVDSRDALITLSAAVGLPVGEPFSSYLGRDLGDVDGDGLTNSRDALLMLSSSIALPIYVTNRLGATIPDACPGLTPPGETVVFWRASSLGDGGIFRLDPLSTSPTQLTTDPADQYPRLNAAGTTVAFSCLDQGVPPTQVCLVDLVGANRRLLTGPGTPARSLADWSPDGTKLAYLQGGTLFTMDALGANQTQVSTPPISAGWVAWSHDGTRLAYQASGSRFLRTVLVGPPYTDVSLGDTTANRPIGWSPGDTLVAYQPASVGPIWSISTAGGGTPKRLVALAGNVHDFDWGPAGIVFSMTFGAQLPSLWLLKGGPSGTLVRLTAPVGSYQDHMPSFRRNP